MIQKNKKFKFSVISQDGLSIILIGIAIICAFSATELLFKPKKNLNAGSLLIYITMTTLSASIIEPVLSIFKVEKKKSKFFSIGLGVIASLTIYIHVTFFNPDFFNHLISFSKRGGLTAISVALLILQLALMNYELQIESEKELESKQKEIIEIKKELIKTKKKLIEKR